MSDFQDKFDQAIWKTVAAIPAGQVMPYGEVAKASGFPRHARMVSRAMSRSSQRLPWHRIVRSNMTLAFEPGTEYYVEQKSRLQEEGVVFDGSKIIAEAVTTDMDALIWGPE